MIKLTYSKFSKLDVVQLSQKTSKIEGKFLYRNYVILRDLSKFH